MRINHKNKGVNIFKKCFQTSAVNKISVITLCRQYVYQLRSVACTLNSITVKFGSCDNIQRNFIQDQNVGPCKNRPPSCFFFFFHCIIQKLTPNNQQQEHKGAVCRDLFSSGRHYLQTHLESLSPTASQSFTVSHDRSIHYHAALYSSRESKGLL